MEMLEGNRRESKFRATNEELVTVELWKGKSGMALSSEPGWATEENGKRAISLFLDCGSACYFLPWSLFLFAEGTDAELRATFHPHVVHVQGFDVSALLSALADQSVTRLIEPDRMAKSRRGRFPDQRCLHYGK